MNPDIEASIHSEVLRYVESCRSALGLRPEEMRVLDYGCGSGGGVLVLRRRGYQAFGANIDANCLDEARALLKDEGYDQSDVFSVVPPMAERRSVTVSFTSSILNRSSSMSPI